MEMFHGAVTPAKKARESLGAQRLFSPVAPFTPLQPTSSSDSQDSKTRERRRCLDGEFGSSSSEDKCTTAAKRAVFQSPVGRRPATEGKLFKGQDKDGVQLTALHTFPHPTQAVCHLTPSPLPPRKRSRGETDEPASCASARSTFALAASPVPYGVARLAAPRAEKASLATGRSLLQRLDAAVVPTSLEIDDLLCEETETEYGLETPLTAPTSVFGGVVDSDDDEELVPMPTRPGFINRVPSLNQWMTLLNNGGSNEAAAAAKPVVPVRGVISFGDLVALQQEAASAPTSMLERLIAQLDAEDDDSSDERQENVKPMDTAEAAKRNDATLNKLHEMYCGSSTAAQALPPRSHAMVDFGAVVEEKMKAQQERSLSAAIAEKLDSVFVKAAPGRGARGALIKSGSFSFC